MPLGVVTESPMFESAVLLLVAAIVFAPVMDAFMQTTAWLFGAASRREPESLPKSYEIHAH